MQGFIYNQLYGTPFEKLHDKKGYKYFCFSNIFKPNKNKEKRNFSDKIKENDELRWLISSPNPDFIETLKGQISKKIKKNENMQIGDALFKPKSTKPLRIKLEDTFKMITATPVVIRIPQHTYANYGIASELPYLYWRKEHGIEAFINQLEKNLLGKYSEYKEKTNVPLFEFSSFDEFYNTKELIPIRIIAKQKETINYGSSWTIKLNSLDDFQRKIIDFSIDCGFGERNTYGCGFINVI